MIDKIEFIFEIIIKIITFIGILPIWMALIMLLSGMFVGCYLIIDRKGSNRMENLIKYENTMKKLEEAEEELTVIQNQKDALKRREERLDKQEADLEADRESLNWDIKFYGQIYEELRSFYKDAGTYPEMEKLVENGLRGQISIKEPLAMELKPLIKSVGLTTYDQDQTVRKSLIKCVKGPYRTFIIDCFDILTGKGMPPVIVAYMLYYYLSTKQPD